jgi:HEAT repeat protein
MIGAFIKWLTFSVVAYCIIAPVSYGQELNSDNESAKTVPGKNQPLLSEFEIKEEYGSEVKSAIPALLEGLKSKEVNIRRNAAFALGEIGAEAEPAVNDLAHALIKDSDREVRRNAAFALGEIGPPSIPFLIEGLNDRDSQIRRNASAALVRIGHPSVPYLIKLLQNKTPIIRKNAADILGRIEPKAEEAIPALEKALNDDDKSFCWTVKQALRNIKQATVKYPAESLKNKDGIIRKKAAKKPGGMDEQVERAITTLILCLNDKKAEVRKNAAFALAHIGKPALPALIEALKSNHIIMRRNAAFTLGEIGREAEEAIPSLIKLLNDPDSGVRWSAYNAIKKIEKTQ